MSSTTHCSVRPAIIRKLSFVCCLINSLDRGDCAMLCISLHRINVIILAEKVEIVGGIGGKAEKVRGKPQKRGGDG